MTSRVQRQHSLPEKERAAALILMTLPGAKLLYEGQLEGRKIRPPVFLARRPIEPIDADLQAFYHQLLATIKQADLREGEWLLCERSGWPDNSSYMNLVAWCWSQNESHYLVVVNLSEDQSQARIHLPWNDLAAKNMAVDRFDDPVMFSSETAMRCTCQAYTWIYPPGNSISCSFKSDQ